MEFVSFGHNSLEHKVESIKWRVREIKPLLAIEVFQGVTFELE